MINKPQGLQFILDGLVRRYKERLPDVQKIVAAMMQEGIMAGEEEIENDHIAFRTMGVPHLGVQSLEKIFLFYGYRKMDYYFFPEKKLNAWWYAPPAPGLPRIFISELRVQDLSPRAEAVITSYTNFIKRDPVDLLDLEDPVAVDAFLHSSLWKAPTAADYELLAAESEYAAWTIYNRYYLNHFTLAVHSLKEGYNTVELFNTFLEKHGLILNDAGGKIKRSADGALLQSSTVASMVEAAFADGQTRLIPGSYVEFAERKVAPVYQHLSPGEISARHRREGFEAANADKIFESTFLEQSMKKEKRQV
jgi:hypothetical protein